ncbi:hypothetical protein LI291_01085 [Intestinibacillus massiliensis]|nr:hypothetical protein [Intestinibacillus massiliensis]
MSIKQIAFQCVGLADDDAMKTQLGALPGVVEMNIDSSSHAVDVRYDDTRISAIRIEACLNNPNYRMHS